ncbi:hypothetical protein M433DRAFT_8624 [Acidomyces richmondensis BFW]|nr:hypothetical protein M433DRAFT_8624 [Acidomyces richmondensis BFW]
MVLFKPAAALIPAEIDLMKDPKFQRDREELWVRSWTKEAQNALRPAALAHVRANFDFLEDVLSDGRRWILGGNDAPMLVDAHGIGSLIGSSNFLAPFLCWKGGVQDV